MPRAVPQDRHDSFPRGLARGSRLPYRAWGKRGDNGGGEELLVVENCNVQSLMDGNSNNQEAFEAYKKAVVAGRR